RYIRKGAVAIVVEEDIPTIVGHVEIKVAVPIIVAHGDSHAVSMSQPRNARLRRDIGKGAVMVVVEEMIAVPRRAFSIDQNNVQPAVVIVIEDRAAGSRSLHKGCARPFAGSGLEMDSGLPRDVRKERRGG